ncbi:MAG: hypothetical protein QOH43_3144 [Solirubrobacteraceae bacterium]|nr:hypothetical protein [Solirubrobacteraceae bacterium]
MGKRSRKSRPGAAGSPSPPRAPAPMPPRQAASPGRRADRRARMEEAPPAPWSPFPLVELCILLGIVLIVWGFFDAGRRGVLLGCGFVLVSLSGLELALREHMAGFRSHSLLLAAVCALAVITPLFLLTSLPQVVLLVVGLAVLAAVTVALRRIFARRSGGLGFRA